MTGPELKDLLMHADIIGADVLLADKDVGDLVAIRFRLRSSGNEVLVNIRAEYEGLELTSSTLIMSAMK